MKKPFMLLVMLMLIMFCVVSFVEDATIGIASADENEPVFGEADAADGSYHLSASVSGDGPVLNVIVRDTRKRNPPEAMRENIRYPMALWGKLAVCGS